MLPLFEEIRREYVPRQLSFIDTVQRVAENDLSFVRVGDGELRMAFDITYKLGFQKNSENLRTDLIRAIEDMQSRDGVLFGVPHFYRDLHWSTVWSRIWPELKEILAPATELGNAHATRPVYFQAVGRAGVDAWRSVWEGKRVTVITGKTSRFEALPELFDNVVSINRIDSVDKDAYSDVQRLLTEADNATDTDIFLIALGPAGTVLSSQLVLQGRRAIDVGHISDSYQVAFESGAWPEAKPASKK